MGFDAISSQRIEFGVAIVSRRDACFFFRYLKFAKTKQNKESSDLMGFMTQSCPNCQSAGERHKRSVQGVRPHVSNAPQD